VDVDLGVAGGVVRGVEADSFARLRPYEEGACEEEPDVPDGRWGRGSGRANLARCSFLSGGVISTSSAFRLPFPTGGVSGDRNTEGEGSLA
jgi:hypothetical protein